MSRASDRIVLKLASAIIAAASLLAALERPCRCPNILLITLDTTRADHIGAYGSSAARTPVLDRWRNAASFLNERMLPLL